MMPRCTQEHTCSLTASGGVRYEDAHNKAPPTTSDKADRTADAGASRGEAACHCQCVASSAHASALAAIAAAMRACAVLHAQKGSAPPLGDAIDPA